MNSIIHIAILSLVLSWCLTDANAQFRVFNGNDISIEESPHSIAIIYDNAYKCVGSLVSLDSVVTVAHSVIQREPKLFLLLAGVADLHEMNTERAQKRIGLSTHPHPDYNGAKAYADIAVIKVAELFLKTNQVKPISLCGLVLLEECTSLRISGWGSVNRGEKGFYNLLQTVALYISNLEECKLIYQNIKRGYLSDTIICARVTGSNPFYGDSGAGAVVEGKLCAVVQGGCDSINIPSLYTDVTHPIVNAFLRSMIKSN